MLLGVDGDDGGNSDNSYDNEDGVDNFIKVKGVARANIIMMVTVKRTMMMVMPL